MKRFLTALTGLFCLVTSASCLPGMSDGGSSSTCGGSMGSSRAAAQIEAFLGAASAFNSASVALERDTMAACQRMGRALGMTEAELSGSGADGLRAVCGGVNQRFRSELAAAQQANVQITLMARPPECHVSVDAYARCSASCEGQIDPGSVQIQCEGGELRGRCDATCSGSCAVNVNASCSGRCEGACEGTCSARNADGSCAGTCSGTCHGQCVASASASCQGECRGSCSVEFREPYCVTNVEPANVSVECDAACDARLEAQATCEPGEVYVSVAGTTNGDLQTRVDRIRMAAREGLASIVTLRGRAQRLAVASRDVVRLFPGAAQGAVTVSATAASCMAAAAGGVVQSMASVQVSVEVSVQVSGSVSASGG